MPDLLLAPTIAAAAAPTPKLTSVQMAPLFLRRPVSANHEFQKRWLRRMRNH